jgi:hypothetical protein
MENMNDNRQQGFSAVKPDEGKKGGDKWVIIGVGAAIIVILVAAGYWIFGVKKGNSIPTANNNNDMEFAVDENDVANENVDFVFDSEMGNDDVTNNNLESVSSEGFKSFSSTKIAILADPDLFDFSNNNIQQCDSVVLVDKRITPTPKILNSTLKTLFEDKFDYGFYPANFVATQKDLKFADATIDNGVAKIYLTGEIGPINGECDKTRIQTQIRETALQFDSVKLVIIYLNNEPLD